MTPYRKKKNKESSTKEATNMKKIKKKKKQIRLFDKDGDGIKCDPNDLSNGKRMGQERKKKKFLHKFGII